MQDNEMNNRIDKMLSRSSHVAQIVLVFVAVYGYFYTVVPVYQKELLSEEISKKELELTELKRKVSNFPKTIELLKEKVQKHKLQVANLKEEEYLAKQSITSLLDEKNQLKRSLKKVRLELNSAKSGADNTYKEIYIESFNGAVMFQYLRKLSNPYEILDKQEKSAIDSFLLTPYQAILEVLNDGNPQTLESSKLVPKRIKDAMNQRIKKKLLEHKHSLSVPLKNINLLIEVYKEKMKESSVEQTQKDRFNEAQFKLRKKYAVKLNEASKNEMKRSTEFMEQF